MAFTRQALESRDHLVLADNLTLLSVLPDSSCDLVYIDPPFATGKRRESPQQKAGPEGFDDVWDSLEHFIQWLAPRLAGLWRILSDAGNLIIHLDTRAVHHVRLHCDREFGIEHWENEIIWHYTGGGRSKKRFSRKHDVLLWYSKGPDRAFNIDTIREPYKPTSGYARGGIVSKKGKKYLPHPEGTPADDVWDIPIVNPLASERTAYPTQKPLKLLERIIAALSSPGSIVCDVFSGSGTTALACRKLGRRFLCCDSNPSAIWVTLDRLREHDPIAQPPALLSQALYRLPAASADSLEGAADEFARDGLGIESPGTFSAIPAPWAKRRNPPPPLARGDSIAWIAS